MIRSKLMRREVLPAAVATLFAVPSAAAEADSVMAAHPSCTGLILNEITSNGRIGFYYQNDAFRNLLSPGNTWNGTVDRPIDRFRLFRPAKVDYYDLRSWRFLGSHANVQPGIYAKDPCHLDWCTCTRSHDHPLRAASRRRRVPIVLAEIRGYD